MENLVHLALLESLEMEVDLENQGRKVLLDHQVHRAALAYLDQVVCLASLVKEDSLDFL